MSVFQKGKDDDHPKEREVACGAASEVGSPKSSQIIASSAPPPPKPKKRRVAGREGAGGSTDNGERHTGAGRSKKLKFGGLSIDSPPNLGGSVGGGDVEPSCSDNALDTPTGGLKKQKIKGEY
ncbi:MAG: hypothetical protein COA94_02430 [Rickettsiales bacterium]|nr:MAG: hypothetical protein COA94_02430 [Rickettsiales bacterium]